MDAKLTLKLDKYVIEKAKAYASSNNKSHAQMYNGEKWVSNFVQSRFYPWKDRTIQPHFRVYR